MVVFFNSDELKNGLKRADEGISPYMVGCETYRFVGVDALIDPYFGSPPLRARLLPVLSHTPLPARIMVMNDCGDGGGQMRRYRRMPGVIIMSIGLMIVLSMILPTAFWWFLFGLGLIAAGICIMRS